ncbi:iron ABC transporter permease [Marinomonas sp. UCMA 3892]|uniref:iron chelate uptake ABC transporter family permease subunit n=1 Tax=unclassified Marinomonas TaxID=196814 RepID=UPI00146CDB3E|nr:iron chelate uptake ABC transporter family permease subunit [Marinomonas sp. UCMA 3892]NLU99488.1 iron ABC transporter permease [Marinomonas sp. UCMA 3892]
MSTSLKIWGTLLFTLLLMCFFILIGSDLDFNYIIPKRLLRLATILLGSICLAVSAVLFQTIVGNRILSPSIMGYESVYLLWQAVLLFMLGAHGLTILSVSGNFAISITIMLFYSWALHFWLLPRCKNNIFMLLLFGLVLTTVITTATQFIQLSISPGEFSIFQGLSYTSFNRSKPETLLYGAFIVAVCLWMGRKTLPILDVMSLGKEQSISLGVDHAKYISLYLALIAVLVAISTSLIGPTGFMGIFIANIAYVLAGSNKHRTVIPIAVTVSLIIFLVAQLFVEHVFNYKTSVSILINLVCGVYFLALIARTRGTT